MLEEKALVSGKGIDVYISLIEAVLFLRGFEQQYASGENTVVVRGVLHLHITKSAKIKAVTLSFQGKAVTKWPKGDHSTLPLHAHTLKRHKAFLLKKSDSKKRRPLSTIYGRVLILRSKQQQLEPVLIMSGFLNIFH
jgi:hypothetical protein